MKTSDVIAYQKVLQEMTVPQIQQRFTEVTGEPTRIHHKASLIKRLLWHLQALDEGVQPGPSPRALERAAELAKGISVRKLPPADFAAGDQPSPRGGERAGGGATVSLSLGSDHDDRVPPPGTFIRRQYKGRTLMVRVLDSGFEFEGTTYRTLSAIAKQITGSHWNGFKFFGLYQSQSRPPSGDADGANA
jgi:hypothetical protein